MIDYSRLSQEQGLRRDYQILNNYFEFEGDGLGVGCNFGLLWKVSDKVAVGATFRSMTSVDYHGETEILNQPTIYTPWTTDAQLTYDFPLTAAFGLSFRPTPKWNLEINADYTDWSSFDTLTLYQDQQPPDGILRNIPITLEWKASWIYSAGVTYFFESGWQISAGYLFSQNSVPDDYYSPVIADLDRHFASVGTGFRGDGWTVDLTYQFGYGPERVVSGSQAPSRPSQVFGGQNADGTYEWISHAVLLSFGLQF
jgi:long-chain fatty acid transport protein